MKLLDTLRKNGFDITVRHRRFVAVGDVVVGPVPVNQIKGERTILPHGGETEVSISDPAGEFYGIAYCSPADNFNRTEGIEIALRRALDVRALTRYSKKVDDEVNRLLGYIC